MSEAPDTRKEEKEEKRERLPLDARLLADAVIELNISRRSVSIYPPDHPVTRESVGRAFEFLLKLFELRGTITLGIAKDILVVDEHVLDRKNPVFREFALSLHEKGIAAVTFVLGLTVDELQGLHEIITDRGFTHKEIGESAQKKGIRNIRITPLDVSKFGFVEGKARQSEDDTGLWMTYVSSLLEGRLPDDYSEGLLLSIPPEQMATAVMGRLDPDQTPVETYDRVITSYLKKNERTGVRPELFSRFLDFIDKLGPGLKQQFLSRALGRRALDAAEMEHLVREISRDEFDRLMKLFADHSALIPESIRNLLDKLDKTKAGRPLQNPTGHDAVIDDISISEEISSLFGTDSFTNFVSGDYRTDLRKMLSGPRTRSVFLTEQLERECRSEAVEARFSELVLELIEAESLTRDDYLRFLTGMSALASGFLDTGRFRQISDIYNTLYSHTLTGRFREEAKSMLEFYFNSADFINRFVAAVKMWGRFDREGVIRMVRVQKLHLIDPLMNSLVEEKDAAIRRFLLQVLASLGSDILPEAGKRLEDGRWYVVRNMLYLIREARGTKLLQRVRRLARHEDSRVCIEAVRTLMQFGTTDALTYLRHYLRSSDQELKEQAVRLAGIHRCEGLMPELLEILQKKTLLGDDTPVKLSATKALAEIGDPRSVPVLMKVCTSRPILYRRAGDALKLEIFRSLAHYPRSAVALLLDLGLKSGNEEIRAICTLLTDEGNADAAT